MDSEDGETYIKNLANYVHSNEKALANVNTTPRRGPISRHTPSHSMSSAAAIQRSPTLPARPSTSASSLSFTPGFPLSLGFGSRPCKSTKLSFTPHHLFYLLSRFEELGIDVGPLKIRLENIQDTSNTSNYVSFLSSGQRSKTHGSDIDSIRSVSSIRSVMSSVTTMWSHFGFGGSISAARTERHKAFIHTELKYLYSSFTIIPALRLAPDWRARLVRGYEEFPFDSAVPLHAFKNVQTLDLEDIDFRQFFGWDRMADQLKSLTLRRASIDDPADILIDIVLDDMDGRRRRTAKAQHTPPPTWTGNSGAASSHRRSPTIGGHGDVPRLMSPPASPDPRCSASDMRIGSLNILESAIYDTSFPTNSDSISRQNYRMRSTSVCHPENDDGQSPTRIYHPAAPTTGRSRHDRDPSMNLANQTRVPEKVRRSGSGSSHSSLSDSFHSQVTARPHSHQRRGSASNLLHIASNSSTTVLPATKWRFLRHLSLSDNALTTIPGSSLAPLANTLHSLDLSSNLFTQVPDSLAILTALRALNLAHCMIDSLHSLTRNPLPAILSLNLRANRLQSLSGIEKLLPLERLDLRENRLTDPVELARLTGIPYIREIWVEGNPFIRTHKDYRITIFNLFRKTPGYTEDLVIDGSGPSYSEKRYLLDRVPVPAAVPVVRQPAPEVYLVDIGLGSTSPTPKPTATYEQHCRAQREPTVLRKDRPTPRPVTNDAHRSPHRRKKGSKRRIVDLSTSEPSRLPPPTMLTNDMTPPPIPSEYLRGSQSQKAPVLPSFPQASSQKTPASKASTCATSSKEASQHECRKPEICEAATPATATTFTDAPPAIPSARVATINKPNASRHRHRISQSSDVSQPEPASPPLEAQAQTPKVVPAADSCANTVCSVISPESDMSVLYGSGEPDGSEWDMSGELYRRKIEALRSEVGERYLTMLSETALTEGSLADGRWKASPSVEFAPDYRPAISTVSPLQPASISKPTVVSGRMIG
ncbi:hypothetical protein Cpir12675_005263 [Ceratocystis pirilliformis]|uniref:NXF1/2/3/5-like leucine-rich repeat domain-containing protein n=1 Tax=Ceratocystis pirilliformis TaxID=259994 RepID=A0ABR3YRU3_9PEZI